MIRMVMRYARYDRVCDNSRICGFAMLLEPCVLCAVMGDCGGFESFVYFVWERSFSSLRMVFDICFCIFTIFLPYA